LEDFQEVKKGTVFLGEKNRGHPPRRGKIPKGLENPQGVPFWEQDNIP